jgi:DNA/RNA-binding domain of Phe-tRNA-synthetase-like protein
MRLIVSDEVRARFPGYRALVLVARGARNGPSDSAAEAMLRAAEERARARLGGRTPSELPEIAAWRAAMSAFGCKPSRYPCSAEALMKRVARGEYLPAINRLVDAYNAVSIAHALPLGGEDCDRVAGDVVLAPAAGDEEFDGDEGPRPGEVVWRDELGVTCRAWNWRQGRRTRITEDSANVYFLLESLHAGAHERLEPAAEELMTVLDGAATELLGLP